MSDALAELEQLAPELTEKLLPRQRQFVSEYLIDLNATQAAIRAGYSPNAVHADLLKHPGIAHAVQVGMAQRASRVKVTQDSVLHEMSILANSRVDWFKVDETGNLQLTETAPEGAMGAVSSIKRRSRVFPGKNGDPGYVEYEVEFKLWDKPAPLKLMGRHVGLFSDKLDITITPGTEDLSKLSPQQLAERLAALQQQLKVLDPFAEAKDITSKSTLIAPDTHAEGEKNGD